MWPDCIDRLIAYEVSLNSELPKFLQEGFKKLGISDRKEMFVPISIVKLLGQCNTAAYPECPNLPEWYLECDYLENIGKYFWFDFDIFGSDDRAIELRAVYNEGDADANDGTWGAVWDRNTQELVANLTSTGDGEATIEVVSEDCLENYQPHDRSIPLSTVENEPVPFIFFYKNNLQLERLIGLAIRWVHAYSYPYHFKRQYGS